jgi:uncharacterized metal-binding protein
MGVLTLIAFLIAYGFAAYSGDKVPALDDVARMWKPIGDLVRANLGQRFLITVFFGLWFGAASHTFTDLAGSFIKTGRIAKFL